MLFEGIFSLILAILGLGFLIFIHELGHYWMARKEGMIVEAFSIGFGKPLFSWTRDSVRWQIGWIPFGGYVKIAGMQKERGREPHEILGGFYSKTPWQRIKVSFLGPAVNILFGILLFSLLWSLGGRERQFAEFTHRIGWIDPTSLLYAKGVRPGDVIETYDGRAFKGIKDLMIAGILKGKQNRIQGYAIDPTTGGKTRFDYTLDNYAVQGADLQQKTIGVAAPAAYLFYDAKASPEGSPMVASGIQDGDRIFWADGESIYSHEHLSHVVNESATLLTVQRNGVVFHAKVPRVHLDELHMTPMEKAELDDWQYEATLAGRLEDLYFIPYLLSPSGEVEKRLEFIDEQDQKRAFQQCQRCAYFHPLEEGDKILAIDGTRISSSYDLLNYLQQRRVLIIVQRDSSELLPISWRKADAAFDELSDRQDLQRLVASIGQENPLSQSGRLLLLNAVEPKPLSEFSLVSDKQRALFEQKRAEIESIQDQRLRQQSLEQFSALQRRLFLGVAFHDRPLFYNPSPLEQLISVFKDTWHTLSNLFSGNLSPKYMSGPVGIVQVVQFGWMQGFKEALYWMGFISLNLGIVNLLPIPVLDGGHILFALYEAVSRRRISAKVMERMVLPFFGLLIAFFIYITYQDLSRLLSRFF